MNLLETDDEIKELINNKMAVLYFTGNSCDACEIIKGKIEKVLSDFPKIQAGELNGETNLKIAAEYNVFSLPIFLLFIEGKEILRIGRNVNFFALEEDIKRYYKILF